ncbi:MAG: HD domain-containing protein [Proteobacteria bacterium]|nr:HD domain-containing protein [Pseudomonadota bacterium]
MTDIDSRKYIDIIISRLNAAIANARIYFHDHPEIGRHIDVLYDEIVNILKIKPHLTLVIVDDDLVESGRPLKTESAVSKQIISILKEKGIEHLTFQRGILKTEIAKFVITIAGKENTPLKSSACLKLGKIASTGIGEDQDQPDSGMSLDGQRDEGIPHIRQNMSEIKKVYINIKQKKGINAVMLGEIVAAFADVFERGHNPINLLAMIRSTDEYTFTHVVNVCILTMSQAESLGFKGEILYQIGIASMLHDVGKLFIPEAILNKPGALTPEERKVIDGHVVKGALYIMGLKDVPRISILGALEHHIKYDGGGYPRIKGDYKPHIASQIIAIADAYDAMRSKRSYQDAKKKDVIIDILKEEKGKSYDPFLVDNFIRLITS